MTRYQHGPERRRDAHHDERRNTCELADDDEPRPDGPVKKEGDKQEQVVEIGRQEGSNA